MLAVVVPFALAFIFNAIFGGVTGSSNPIALGAVNEDGGPVGRTFVDQVLRAVDRSGVVSVRPEPTVRRARSLTAAGTLNAAIAVPPGFSRAVQANRPAALHVIGNVDSPISVEIARSIAESFASRLNGVRLSVATVVTSGEAVP